MTDKREYPRPPAEGAALRWAIIYTKPGVERSVGNDLVAAGFGAYVPAMKRWVKPRHVKTRKQRPFPLFPRYLFVGMNPLRMDYETVRRTDGVGGFLCAIERDGNRPAVRVPWETVEGIVTAQDMGVFDEDGTSPPPFKAGDAVRFVDSGSFNGHTAEVISISKKAVSVEVRMLGRRVAAVVPLELLRLIA